MSLLLQRRGIISSPFSADLVSAYVATAGSPTGTTTRTFSSVSIGAVPAGNLDRYVVAYSAWKDGSTSPIVFSSGTVDGNAATKIGSISDSGTSSRSAVGGIIYGPINTGTTANFAMTWNTTPSFDYLSVFTIMASRGHALTLAPAATLEDVTAVGDHPGGDINVGAGGTCIAAAISSNGGVPSWTGLTKSNDQDVDSNDYFTVAKDDFASAQSPLAIIAAYIGEVTGCILAASWSKPA